MSSSPPSEPPVEIVVHQRTRRLEIAFADGERHLLDFEFLRVHSPSAEVQGHGPGQDTLQTGKQLVTVASIEPVGHYAIRPSFSDGHDSGIFTWGYLRRLGREHDAMWTRYLARLSAAGASRMPDMPAGDAPLVASEVRRSA